LIFPGSYHPIHSFNLSSVLYFVLIENNTFSHLSTQGPSLNLRKEGANTNKTVAIEQTGGRGEYWEEGEDIEITSP